MGHVGQQSPRQVLFHHRLRRKTARPRNRKLAAHFRCCWPCTSPQGREIAMEYARTSRLRSFAARLAGLFAPRKQDRDFTEEMQAHLQLLAETFVAQGMSQRDADAAARRQFGNTTRLQE